jgi:protein O-GlcNAc transferase
MSETGDPQLKLANLKVMALGEKLKLGMSLYQQDKLAEAEQVFQEVLHQQPDHFDALHLLGVIAIQTRHTERAVELIRQAIRLNANVAAAHNNLGRALLDLKCPMEALASFDKAVALEPDFATAHSNRGHALLDLNRPEEAFASFNKTVTLKPDYAACYNCGNALLNLNKPEEALACYDMAIALNSDFAEAYCSRGLALQLLKQPEEALANYDRAIALKPDYAEAHNNRGNALLDLKRSSEALVSYDEAIALKPDYSVTYYNRGNALLDLKRPSDAAVSYDKAIALKSDFAEAQNNLGNALLALKRPREALASYDKAIAVKWNIAEAHNNRGNALLDLKRPQEAMASYEKAIALRPDYAGAYNSRVKALLLALNRPLDALASYEKAIALTPDFAMAYNNRGKALEKLNRYDEAFIAYDKAFALESDLTGAEGDRLNAKMRVCDWSNFDLECAHLVASVRSGNANTSPFVFLTIPSSPAEQLQCARLWVTNKFPPSQQPIWQGERYNHKRIRVGYVSADFYQHATAFLMAGMFECHDRSRFDVTAISIGPNDNSAIRQRLEASFERFIEAHAYGDDQIADLVRSLEIDLLVDLKGFTTDSQTSIFARRPAPIQVNYLGYPGTMGAAYIDYILADRIVVPENQRECYSEKIAYLPNSYQVNDAKRSIADNAPMRIELGLPVTGFVFCCFNNNYKITPRVFDCWMRILKQVEGSVFWLLEDNVTAAINLKKEAVARGLTAERLIFAKRMPLPEHLARHRLADLFLDTLPCNAHTTASDALWAGLPVLTCLGESFAGRVAASLLNAVGLPELITTTLEAYEQMAIDLAAHPDKLANIKHKLAEKRLTSRLFDTKLVTKHVEAAYTVMYERHYTNRSPDHIYVPE